jgi:hypothetical protein
MESTSRDTTLTYGKGLRWLKSYKCRVGRDNQKNRLRKSDKVKNDSHE